VSDPLRYDPGLEQGITDAEAVMFQCPDGAFVKYADYAALQAEVERLRKACELVFDESAKRKFLMCYRGDDFYVSLQAMEAMSEVLGYSKAKEGKQS
jgi:hypothetical protein